MTNESALLGLLADLYAQRETLRAENTKLRDQVRLLMARETPDPGQ